MKKKILFVDDDYIYAQNVIEELLPFYRVQYVKNIIEAEAFVLDEEEQIDGVILDIQMPNPDRELFTDVETDKNMGTGFLFISRNREMIVEKRLPIFILTNRQIDEYFGEIVNEFSLPQHLITAEAKHSTNARLIQQALSAFLQLSKYVESKVNDESRET